MSRRTHTAVMKRTTAACAAAIILAGTGAPPASAFGNGTGEIAMYRLYNPNTGEHFYTSDDEERDHLLLEHWRDEGIGWYAPARSDTPVFRLYNPYAGDHHYTMDPEERDYLIRHQWEYEGVGWYSDDHETVPLYRQYNPHAKAGSHNYTTNRDEGDVLVSVGWRAEGVGWYALAEGAEQQPVTFEEDQAYASIESKMALRGTGSGYHTKIDISDDDGVVVSFGIQYEKDLARAYPQYRSGTAFLMENVMSHATEPGPRGKEYLYLKEATVEDLYRVRLSWYQDDNTVRVYVDDHEIGRTRTTLQPPLIFSVEGSVARNGDTINGSIIDVRIKAGDGQTSYGTMGEWNDRNDYFGLDAKISKYGSVNTADDPYKTHNGHTYGADFVLRGTADIPGEDENGSPWTWDTSFGAVEPNTGTTGHPLSAIANIAQYRG